eukprot:c21326_g1_i1.p1 GENE.c21326_g1_i1~~c21326_g1_i1.p1  ORF type:complete len:393 (-),score=86.89 c21326_g1_i1:137-1315(-)
MSVTEEEALRVLSDVASSVLLASNIAIGHTLGLFAVIKERGPLTPHELASAAGCRNARLVQEWALHLLAWRILHVEDSPAGEAAPDSAGQLQHTRLGLVPSFAVCLVPHQPAPSSSTSPPSPRHSLCRRALPLVLMSAQSCKSSSNLVECFRTGQGLNWDTMPDDSRDIMRDYFRPLYEVCLPVWMRAVPGLAALQCQGSLVFDVGCGCGESSMLIARLFPLTHVTGVDYDPCAISIAKEEAKAKAIGNCNFILGTSHEAWAPSESVDIVCFLACLHDMAAPSVAVAIAYNALKRSGVMLVIEPQGSDEASLHNLLQVPNLALQAGFSSHMCTPSSLGCDGRGEGWGACVHTGKYRECFARAGFGRVELLELVGSQLNPASVGYRVMTAYKN